MPEFVKKRKYTRMPVGLEHRIRFAIGATSLEHVPLANLSAGGCLALVPAGMASHVRPGLLLMDCLLEHGEMPDAPICSRIMRIEVPNNLDGHFGLGIAFLSTSPDFYEQINTYVARHLGCLD
nr:PilZ domain-containing protein [uncultured Holophaga sp.]